MTAETARVDGPRLPRLLLVSGGAVVFLGLLFAIPAFACTPSASAESRPARAEAGSTVQTSGTLWDTEGGTVSIQWDGGAGPLLATAQVNPDGTFSQQITIPSDATQGSHRIHVTQPAGDGANRWVSDHTITVDGPAQEEPSPPGEDDAGSEPGDQTEQDSPGDDPATGTNPPPEDEPAGQTEPAPDPEPGAGDEPAGQPQPAGHGAPAPQPAPADAGTEPDPAPAPADPAPRPAPASAAPSAPTATEPAPSAGVPPPEEAARPAEPAPSVWSVREALATGDRPTVASVREALATGERPDVASVRELLATGPAIGPLAPAYLHDRRPTPDAEAGWRAGDLAAIQDEPTGEIGAPASIDVGPSPWLLVPFALLALGLFSGGAALVAHEARQRGVGRRRVKT